MPSASSGKYKIKSIKVYKDHVTLSFLKHARLQISKEAYYIGCGEIKLISHLCEANQPSFITYLHIKFPRIRSLTGVILVKYVISVISQSGQSTFPQNLNFIYNFIYYLYIFIYYN